MTSSKPISATAQADLNRILREAAERMENRRWDLEADRLAKDIERLCRELGAK